MVEFSRLDAPDAPYFSAWESSSSSRSPSLTKTFYIFNCTNPDDVIILGVAPILEQVGPFMFNAEHQHWNIEWDSMQETITFGTWKWLNEQVENPLSLSLSTQIWTVNFPLIVLIAHGYGLEATQSSKNNRETRQKRRSIRRRIDSISNDTKKYSQYSHYTSQQGVSTRIVNILAGICNEEEEYYKSTLDRDSFIQDEFGCFYSAEIVNAANFLRNILSSSSNSIKNDQVDKDKDQSVASLDLFVQKSAGEILFGYADPIFFALHILDESFPEVYQGLIGNTSSIDISKSETGLSSMRVSDSYEIFTVTEWDGMESIQCCSVGPCGPNHFNKAHPPWASPAANVLGGSSGKPGFRRFDSNNPPSLDLFDEHLLRRIDLLPIQKEMWNNDIPVWRYELDTYLFLNSTINPQNKVYYSPADVSGLFNLSSCSIGSAQVFISKPFFLDGDDDLWKNVSLPPPDRIKHNTHVNVEPSTGAVVDSVWRFQINVQLQGGDNVGHKAIESYYVPLLWSDGRMSVSSAWVGDFRTNVLILQQSAMLLEQVGIAFSCIFMFLAIVFAGYGRYRYYKSKTEELDGKIEALLSTSNDDSSGLLIADGYGLE